MVKRASESLEGPPRCPQPRAGVASFPRARAPGPVLPCAPPGWARLMGSLSDAPRYRLSRRKGGPGKPVPCTHSRPSGWPTRARGRWMQKDGEGPWGRERPGRQAPAAARAGNSRLLFPKPGSGQTAPRPPRARRSAARWSARARRSVNEAVWGQPVPAVRALGARPGPPTWWLLRAAGAQKGRGHDGASPSSSRGTGPAHLGSLGMSSAPSLPPGPPWFSPFCAALFPAAN